MPDRPGSAELAYWVRPGQRGRGIAAQAVRATTPWAHRSLGIPRIWLEINPGNEPSLRVARRAGYRFEQRLPRHCRDWACEDAEHDSWHDCLIWTHEWSEELRFRSAIIRGRHDWLWHPPVDAKIWPVLDECCVKPRARRASRLGGVVP